MLNEGQIRLLAHLKRFKVADKDACLLLLDTDKTRNKDKLLYSLRPLVKNKYISKRSDNLYGLLQKGAEMVDHVNTVLTVGGDAAGRRRAAEVSHIAALLGWHGIQTATEIPQVGQNCFIPSAIWRNLRSGLISTTRFLGILFYEGMRLAVYNVGDGNYEWQMRAECSLHYKRYDAPEKRATGIFLVCNDGCGLEIGEQIVRRTLWERKTLLKRSLRENNKRVPYGKAPIRIRAEYQYVYLAEQSEVMDVLRMADASKIAYSNMSVRLGVSVPDYPDTNFINGTPEVHQINICCDLLALAFFYNDVKQHVLSIEKGIYERLHMPESQYHIYLPEKYAEWGSYLKLPVTVHILTEEEIQWLTESNKPMTT